MASLRRSTAMANDGASAKFLYTMLKQLDHKSIDWNLVASELGITNGHAARMRFSRFKQTMEGGQPTRKPRAESHKQRKSKLDKRRKGDKGKVQAPVKAEQASDAMEWDREVSVKSEYSVKQEPADSGFAMSGYGMPDQQGETDYYVDPSTLGKRSLKVEEQ